MTVRIRRSTVTLEDTISKSLDTTSALHLLLNTLKRLCTLYGLFDQTQKYKPFVSGCIVQVDLEIRSVREVCVRSGLPATTSMDRLGLLDEEEHILGIKIVGDRLLHRLRNQGTVAPKIIVGSRKNQDPRTFMFFPCEAWRL